MIAVRRPVLAAVALSASALLAAAGLSGTGAEHVRTAAARIEISPQVTRVGHVTARPPTTAQCERRQKVQCYGPKQIEDAYDLPYLYRHHIDGRGQTIVIVDAFGSPTIAHDLAVFDRTYRLPAPPSLKVIRPAGSFRWKANSNDEGWAGETTLDVEYAHTIAPRARLLLVETPKSENEGTSGFPQIVRAEKYVIRHHLGDVISQSFSATEETFPTADSLLALRGAYKLAAERGVTVLAASGDSGVVDSRAHGSDLYTSRVTSWPDSDPLVTGVGGTYLDLNSAGRRIAPDSVWNDTYNRHVVGSTPTALAGGGGLSTIFARPSYQNGVQSVVGRRRGVPDVSMSAACSGSVETYQSYPGAGRGWQGVCGTSEATPIFAGIVALAAQVAHHSLGLINPALYKLSAEHARGIVDVTSGNNTVTFTQPSNGKRYTVTGFDATKGYDLASGVGTVDGRWFVPELAHLAR